MDELNKMYTQEAKNTLLGTSTMKWGYTSKQNILGNKLNLKLIHNYRSDQENYYWHILFLWAAHQDEANYKKSPELTEIALPDYIEADILVKHVDPEKENVKYFLEKMKVDFTLNTLKDDWPGMVKAIDMYNGTVENTQLGSNEMGVLHRTINFAEHGPKITTADARFPVYLLWLHMINDSLQPE